MIIYSVLENFIGL